MAELITQSAYARHRQCSLKTVADAIIAGHITSKKVGNNVMIDPKVADVEWERNRNTKVNKNGTDDYSKARALREKANAEKAILQVAEYKSTLIKKEDVERQGFEVGQKIRQALEAMPSRISAKVASKTDPHECEIIMKQEIEDILLELCGIKGHG